jgi:hypothetical protein
VLKIGEQVMSLLGTGSLTVKGEHKEINEGARKSEDGRQELD